MGLGGVVNTVVCTALAVTRTRAPVKQKENIKARGMPKDGLVVLMADYCRDPSHTEMRDIPDVSARVSPYYGGAAQFKLVLDVLEDACEGLMQELVDMLSCHMTGMVECEHDTMHQCYV
eukprot:7520065-Pyramimonas_sp.AAC.1